MTTAKLKDKTTAKSFQIEPVLGVMRTIYAASIQRNRSSGSLHPPLTDEKQEIGLIKSSSLLQKQKREKDGIAKVVFPSLYPNALVFDSPAEKTGKKLCWGAGRTRPKQSIWHGIPQETESVSEEFCAGTHLSKSAVLNPKLMTIVQSPGSKAERRSKRSLTYTPRRASSKEVKKEQNEVDLTSAEDCWNRESEDYQSFPLPAGHLWTSHLTPFRDVIDVKGHAHESAYLYLRELTQSITVPTQTRVDTVSRTIVPERTVHCSCQVEIRPRHVQQFLSVGFDWLGIKQSKAVQTIKHEGTDLPHQNILLIHLEGVVFHFQKLNPFDHSFPSLLMRPDAIQGLRQLAQMFTLVFVTALSRTRISKMRKYLERRKVEVTGLFRIRQENEEKLGKDLASFQDYGHIFQELGVLSHARSRVLLISSITSETHSDRPESALFTMRGTAIHIEAERLPVVNPSSTIPIISLLVPHLGLTDTALKLSVVTKELSQLYVSSDSRDWDCIFRTRRKKCLVINTHKVHEAYFALKLPSPTVSLIRRTGPPELAGTRLCAIHENAHLLANQMIENKVVIMHSDTEEDFAPRDWVTLLKVKMKTNWVNLMDFTMTKSEN